MRLVEKEGTATQGDRELLVALATAATPELEAEELARESAYITCSRSARSRTWITRTASGSASRPIPAMQAAVDAHRDWVAGETLAVEIMGEGRRAGGSG